MKNYILCAAIKKIAFGYLLIHLHINLGTIDILPGWAGYLLILSAIPSISVDEESAKLLEPLAKILLVANV